MFARAPYATVPYATGFRSPAVLRPHFDVSILTQGVYNMSLHPSDFMVLTTDVGAAMDTGTSVDGALELVTATAGA